MKQMQKKQMPLPPKKKPHGAATAKREAKGEKEVLTVVTVVVDSELSEVLEAYRLAGIDPVVVLKSTLADMMGAKKSAATAPQKKSAKGGSKISLTMRQTKGSNGGCSRR